MCLSLPNTANFMESLSTLLGKRLQGINRTKCEAGQKSVTDEDCT